MGFEHRLAVSSHPRKAWNGGLRLLNLFQFLPSFYIGCAEGISLDPPVTNNLPVASLDTVAGAWEEIAGLWLAP